MSTPLLRQYFSIKNQFPDALVLFQVGDFYELFFDDAKTASAFLGITLTKRGTMHDEPVPLCGVPVHTVDQYLVRLVRGGFRVVLVNQTSAAVPGRMVERAVTQVLTPGTLTDAAQLDAKRASYCVALAHEKDSIALCAIEILTGTLAMTIINAHDKQTLVTELARFSPDELFVVPTSSGPLSEQSLSMLGYRITPCLAPYPDEPFSAWIGGAVFTATRPFIDASGALRNCMMVMHHFFAKHNPRVLERVVHAVIYDAHDFLLIDPASYKNLEIDSLFELLDQAITPMGSRLIKKWLARPLVRHEAIQARLDAIQALVHTVFVREELRAQLRTLGDVERVVGRIALGRAQHQDYVALKRMLIAVAPCRQRILDTHQHGSVRMLAEKLPMSADLLQLLDQALYDGADETVRIKPGYHGELDRLRSVAQSGAQQLQALELQEQERTGIASLKIRFSGISGYAFEVTKTNLDKVPADYIRLQTLTNRERFTTQQLKDYEYELQRAQGYVAQLEAELYAELVTHIALRVHDLRAIAQFLATMDACAALAHAAHEQNFVRPQFTQSRDVQIVGGRHPLVAARLGQGYVPNDCTLNDTQTTWIITGPNMGGKSTFLRSVAHIALMGQAGMFVPAVSATLPLFDRIFTRIGAGDDLAGGKSTFLVEMEETATICACATEKSLVILDEVGRGTSTYDGLAIAQAVLEYLHSSVRARCLFATHYHEITAIAEQQKGVALYHAATTRMNDAMVLLHKIMPGVAGGSFGIEVAKMANIPPLVVARAQEILAHIGAHQTTEIPVPAPDASVHMHAARITELARELERYRPLIDIIRASDPETLSPRAALEIVWRMREIVF